jgi:hypothetical protein
MTEQRYQAVLDVRAGFVARRAVGLVLVGEGERTTAQDRLEGARAVVPNPVAGSPPTPTVTCTRRLNRQRRDAAPGGSSGAV